MAVPPSSTDTRPIQDLLLRLQELEMENAKPDTRPIQDLLRLQELELENAKLKDDLKRLHTSEEKLGMLEYKQEDEEKIMRSLIKELHPAIALSAQPSGLPAFILFMMVRYTDYSNDNDDKVRSLLTSAITFIKRLIRKQGETLDLNVLWLSNILRLLHTFKQYSGDKAFQHENSSKQNDQCLKNFDLSEYHEVLNDHAVWIFMMLVKILEQEIQTMIVPAILENTNIDAEGPQGDRKGGDGPLEELIRKLDATYHLLCSYGLDVEVINQVFRQLFYYVGAGALNNLLVRKELCNRSKGMEIGYNVTSLEEWARGKKMEEVVKATLNPITQASKILHQRKSDIEVDTEIICDFAENLTIQQVVKILILYSGKDGNSVDRVSKTFIDRIQAKWFEKRRQTLEQQQDGPTAWTKSNLLMDTQYTYAVKFPFNPSTVKLEEVNIPESFGIGQWVTRK